MSAPAFAWALERGCALDLSPAERLVLIYLADMANGEMVCWPSQPTIVRFTGLAPNTVAAVVRRLCAKQLIRVDASPGIVTKYHILRSPTPANGAGVSERNPRKSYRGTPANRAVVTPPNGMGAPPQNVVDHPRKSSAQPPHDLRLTPANGGGDPSKTQERDPRARVPARAQGKDLDLEEVGKQAAPPPPAPPHDAPLVDTTTGGAAPLRSSDAFLDDPSPDDALPKAEGELDAADQPVDTATALREFERVKQALRSRNYPPRASSLDRQEQIDAVAAQPYVKPLFLTGAALLAARRAANILPASRA